MDAEAEKLLSLIKADFYERVDKKFRKGNAEHENDIFDLDLIEEAKYEMIDCYVYLTALQEKIKKSAEGQGSK